MADEELKIKISQQGAQEVAFQIQGLWKEIDKVKSIFSELGGPSNPSVAFVNSMQKGMKEASEHVQSFGSHSMSSAHKFRLGTHMITGTVGQMAATVNPALGQMIGTIRLAGMSMLAFGAPVAAAMIGAQLLTLVIENFTKRIKEAQEWQAKFNIAVRSADLSTLRGQLSEINQFWEMESQKGFFGQAGAVLGNWFAGRGGMGDMKDKMDREKQARAGIEATRNVFEGNQRNLNLKLEELSTEKQLLDMNKEQAASGSAVSNNLRRDLEITKEQNALQAELAANVAKEEALRKNLTGQAKEEFLAAAKKKTELQGTLKLQQELQKQEKEMISFYQNQVSQSITIMKTGMDTRMSMVENEKNERLRIVNEMADTDEERSVGAQRATEQSVVNGTRLRIAAIEQEEDSWKSLAAMYPNNVNLQREAQSKMLELASQRVKTEVDANGQIIASRQQMVNDLRAAEDKKAQIGMSLEEKASQSLQKMGYTAITQDMVRGEVERMKGWGSYYAQTWQSGGALSPEQREMMLSMGKDMGALKKTGASSAEATYLAEQQGGADWGLRMAPSEMVSSYTGGYAMDKVAGSFKTVEMEVKKSLESIKNMVSGTDFGGDNLANVITDMVVRKLEFEASRQ